MLKQTIEKGLYKLGGGKNEEPLYIETCLFLLECLQTRQEFRKGIECLRHSPFISDEFLDLQMHELDQAKFLKESKFTQIWEYQR